MQSLMLPVTTFKVAKSSLLHFLYTDHSFSQKNMTTDSNVMNNTELIQKKMSGFGLEAKIPTEIFHIKNAKESSRVKCRFKIEKKYIKLNKKEKDYVFKITPFTMIVSFEEIIIIFNVQSLLLPSLSFNKTILIRVADSSAREELKLAVQENISNFVRQQFNQKKIIGRDPDSKEGIKSLRYVEGYLIRSNVNYSTIQNIVYQKPSIVYVRMREDEIFFYKSHDMTLIADVVAFRVDMRVENISIRPMIGSLLGFEVIVNHDIREQFVASTEAERDKWIKAFNEVITKISEQRQIQKGITIPNSQGSLSSSASAIQSVDDSSIYSPASNDSASSSSIIETSSQKSSGSCAFNDGDSVGGLSRRSNSIFEEPDFFVESSVVNSQPKSNPFSDDFWYGQKRRKSIASTASSQIDYLQHQLEERDQEVRKLKEQLQALHQKLSDTKEKDDSEINFT